jgi:hypothetical protein
MHAIRIRLITPVSLAALALTACSTTSANRLCASRLTPINPPTATTTRPPMTERTAP